MRTLAISQTPTIDTGLYATGDAVGGKLTFDFQGDNKAFHGLITKIIIIDKDSETAPFDLVLFNDDFTATADQSAFDPTDADLLNCLGFLSIATTDYASFADNSVAVKTSGRQMPCDFVCTKGVLYGQLVVRGAPTYTAATDIVVKLIVEVEE